MSHIPFEVLQEEAKKLTPLEKIQFVEWIVTTLKEEIQPRRSLAGLWEGVSVSAEDIDEVRREMWGNFPRG